MLAAFSFLTILGRGTAPAPRAVPYFPLVGLVVGAGVGYAWFGALHWWPPLVAAAVAVAVDALLTGLLHLDGLADSGDGLIAPMTRQKRLAAMRDPGIGAFGVVSVALVLLLRVAAITALGEIALGRTGPVWIAHSELGAAGALDGASSLVALLASWRGPLLFAALWCLSRAMIAAIMTALPYARGNDGLASGFRSARSRTLGFVALIAGGVIASALMNVATGHQLAPLLAAVGGAVLVSGTAAVRIGGFTGDTLGASVVLAETFGLLAVAAL